MFSPHVSSDLSSPAADSGVSECLALTSDSETEIFCDSVDSVEQLSSIRVRRGPGSGARAWWTPVSEVCLSHDQPNFFSYFTLYLFRCSSGSCGKVQRFSQRSGAVGVIWSTGCPAGRSRPRR